MKNKLPKDYEIRSYEVEIKSEEKEGKRFLYGFIPYNKKSVDMGFVEVITPSAFVKSIKEANIKALVDHDPSKVLGTKNNGTLVFDSKEDGLYIACEIPNTSYANDAYEVINRGDITTMSFGFYPVKTDVINGVFYRKEVKLYEVSFMVTFPAYNDTSSIALTRSKIVREKRNIDLDKLGEVLSKEKIENDEDKKLVEETINVLKQTIYIEEENPTTDEVADKPEPLDKPNTQELTLLKELVELETLIDS